MPADTLILVRHGRTASNAAGVWQGHLDSPLDEVGIAEANATAAALGTLLSPARLVSSDLQRAVATAAPLAAAWGLELEQDRDLREVNAGAWEGLSRVQIAEQWPDDLAGWRAGEDVRIGGAERMSEAGERVARRLSDLAEQSDGTLVAVSHGGAIRMATLILTGIGAGHARSLRTLHNAHWCVLSRGESGTFSLAEWNRGPAGTG